MAAMQIVPARRLRCKVSETGTGPSSAPIQPELERRRLQLVGPQQGAKSVDAAAAHCAAKIGRQHYTQERTRLANLGRTLPEEIENVKQALARANEQADKRQHDMQNEIDTLTRQEARARAYAQKQEKIQMYLLARYDELNRVTSFLFTKLQKALMSDEEVTHEIPEFFLNDVRSFRLPDDLRQPVQDGTLDDALPACRLIDHDWPVCPGAPSPARTQDTFENQLAASSEAPSPACTRQLTLL